MAASGFYWPSTVRVSIAVYSSVNDSGTTLAPNALNDSMAEGICCRRSFRPLLSSTYSTGCLLLVTWRKP